MVVAWHDAAFAEADLRLTPAIMERVLSKFNVQHKLKSNWTKNEALIFEKMMDLDKRFDEAPQSSDDEKEETEAEAEAKKQK